MLDLDDFGTLAHGLADSWLCAHLDISPRTLRNYRTGRRPVPKPIMELLRWIHWGELSAIGGSEWEGFTLRGGALSIPLFPRGFDPYQIKSMFFTTQDAWAIRADLAHAQAEIARLTAEIEKARSARASVVRVEIDGCCVFSSVPVK